MPADPPPTRPRETLWWRDRRRLLARSAGVAAALIGVVLAVTGVLRPLELVTVDARFAVRGTDRTSARRALVVAVDAATFARYRNRYPLPRHLYADAARVLRRDGAKATVIDVQFSERSNSKEDNALIDGLREAPGTILVATEVAADGSTDILGGADGQAYARVRVASASLPIDPGDTYRRFDFAQDGLATVPLVAGGVSRSRLGARPAWIDYPGPPGTVPSVSLGDLLAGMVDPAVVRGRYVVIGVTAPTVHDLHSYSALDAQEMSGAEIEAAAILSAVDGTPLRDVPGWLGALLTAALGAGATWLAVRRRPLLGLAGVVVLGLAYAAAAEGAFAAGAIIPVAAPLMTLVLAAAAGLVLAYALELVARAEEVRAARLRTVEVGDEVRRRVERDLHDGAQQRLLTLAMRLGASRGHADDPLLSDAVSELQTTVGELRALVRGDAPPALARDGLSGALLDLAAQVPFDAQVKAQDVGRLDAYIERTAYLVAAEGVANVVKHSHARQLEITARLDDGDVVIEVNDDGVGGADPAGSGLAGLAERIAASRGSLEISSPPGGGTRLTARLPAA